MSQSTPARAPSLRSPAGALPKPQNVALTDSSSMAELANSLLPAPVAVFLSTNFSQSALIDMLPRPDAFARMSPNRGREFLHGRYCAARVLQTLGSAQWQVGYGTLRQPLWPEGMIGSISHCQDVALAVACRQKDLRSIGVDIENACGLEEALWDKICRPEELGTAPKNIDAGKYAKLIFSIKESIYKTLSPLLQQFIDFQDIQVELDTSTQVFSAISHSKHVADELLDKLQGRYAGDGSLIISAAWIH